MYALRPLAEAPQDLKPIIAGIYPMKNVHLVGAAAVCNGLQKSENCAPRTADCSAAAAAASPATDPPPTGGDLYPTHELDAALTSVRSLAARLKRLGGGALMTEGQYRNVYCPVAAKAEVMQYEVYQTDAFKALANPSNSGGCLTIGVRGDDDRSANWLPTYLTVLNERLPAGVHLRAFTHSSMKGARVLADTLDHLKREDGASASLQVDVIFHRGGLLTVDHCGTKTFGVGALRTLAVLAGLLPDAAELLDQPRKARDNLSLDECFSLACHNAAMTNRVENEPATFFSASKQCKFATGNKPNMVDILLS